MHYLLVLSILLVTGCAALPKGSVLFQHTPLLHRGTVEVKAGMDYLDDKRSEKEKKMMKNLSNLNEQITAVVFKV